MPWKPTCYSSGKVLWGKLCEFHCTLGFRAKVQGFGLGVNPSYASLVSFCILVPDILLPAGQYLDLFDSESETDVPSDSSAEELVEV